MISRGSEHGQDINLKNIQRKLAILNIYLHFMDITQNTNNLKKELKYNAYGALFHGHKIKTL